jgi:hypothetical protein
MTKKKCPAAAKKTKKTKKKDNPVGVGYGSGFHTRLERVEEAVSKNANKIDTTNTFIRILREDSASYNERINTNAMRIDELKKTELEKNSAPSDQSRLLHGLQDGALWTFEEAVRFVRQLERELSPIAHVTFGGGVMHKGRSMHDLDIIIFPHSSKNFNPSVIGGSLRRLGMRKRLDHMQVREFWREKGSDDCKRVEVWKTEAGKRVDVMFLK